MHAGMHARSLACLLACLPGCLPAPSKGINFELVAWDALALSINYINPRYIYIYMHMFLHAYISTYVNQC